MDFLFELVEEAKKAAPLEACGLVVSVGDKVKILPAKNLSPKPSEGFDLDPLVWLDILPGESVIGVYHSHPKTPPKPSWADLTSCEASGLPWHIVTPDGGYTCTQPSGFEAPYTERPYVHGVHDCYSIIRDWYRREWNIELEDFDRQDEWWDNGQNLYLDNFESQGFRLVTDEPQIGDVFLLQLMSSQVNHGMIYVGNGKCLHHPRGRLSKFEVYGGMWQKLTTHQVRHISRIKND